MNQVKVGVVLNYAIILLNAVVGLLYTPYMIRCLGQSEYGLYSLVASIIAYLTLLDFGFGPAVVRFTAKYRAEGKTEEQKSLFGLFFILYSVIGIVALGIGLLLYFNIDWLFDRTMSSSDLFQARIMILLLLLNLVVSFPMSVFGSIIGGYERFVFQKSIVLMRIILSTIVMIYVLSLGYKAIALVVVQTIFNLLLLITNCIYCRRILKIRLRFKGFKWTFIRHLLGFSIWVFLGEMMFKFYYNTGQFVLGATSGIVEVALFALGVTLTQMYIMFSGGISGVLLPKITAMVAQQRPDREISDLFIRTGRLQYIVMSIILVSFVILGKPFIYLWAGRDYSQVYYIALIFFLTTLAPLIQNTAISILQARNQQKYRSVVLVIVGGVSLIAQIILSKCYGAIGCAIAVGGANIIGQGLILNWYYHKKQRLDMIKFWREIGKMSVVPIIFAITGIYIFGLFEINSWLNFIFAVGAIMFIYLPLVWKFGMNEDERMLFIKLIQRTFNKLYY